MSIFALAKARMQADIRCDLGQASNVGQSENRRNPFGARQKG
jgi:hypothetical protein